MRCSRCPNAFRFVRGLRAWLGLRRRRYPPRGRVRGRATPVFMVQAAQSRYPRCYVIFHQTAPTGDPGWPVALRECAALSGLCGMGIRRVAREGPWLLTPGLDSLPKRYSFLLVDSLGDMWGNHGMEVKQRPIFIVDRTINLPPSLGPSPAGKSWTPDMLHNTNGSPGSTIRFGCGRISAGSQCVALAQAKVSAREHRFNNVQG